MLECRLAKFARRDRLGAIDGVVAEVAIGVGSIDVLVNNTGYGHEGIMEESPISEMHRQFDVNVFGGRHDEGCPAIHA